MPREHEAKILNVDPGAIETCILDSGGRYVGGPVLMRRYVYDIRRGDESRWLRLRASGDVATIAVKQILYDGIDGVEEIEVHVDNFDVMNEILGQLGLAPKSYQENRRTSYTLGNAKLDIDEWPLLPPYLEIEADSTEDVIQVAAMLGYSKESLSNLNTLSVYAASGLDLLAYSRLTFDDAHESVPGER